MHERYRQDRQRSNSIGQTVLQTVALCYRTNVCACLATLVHCGQTVGWIKMPLGMKVNLGRPGHTVLDGDRVPPSPQQRGTATPQFSAHVCCSKTAGWTMIPYGMEIGLDLGDIIRWVPSSPLVKGHSSHPTCGQTVAHLSNCWAVVNWCDIPQKTQTVSVILYCGGWSCLYTPSDAKLLPLQHRLDYNNYFN